jgi:hypothetical protein
MPLPFEIRNQIIQCIGLCFHYKDNVESFFVSCGIDRRLASKYRDQAKFVWARNLLNDLDDKDNGFDLQRRILTELCKFRNIPDKDAPNPDAGLGALRKLKELAVENKFEVEEVKKDSTQRKVIAQEKQKLIEERAKTLIELKTIFYNSLSDQNRQGAGYSLEDILERLFPLFDIDYRKSYKTGTQQIDGHFKFEGFDYLVEAKWRADQPNENEIGGFERKVNTKLESTRGVFISINGTRDEVIAQFNGKGSNILFLSGEDLVHILEGRIDLREALRKKVDKAAQEGQVYTPITSMI